VTELSGLWTPLTIFVAEMCVVTLGTLRIIFVSRGQKVLAPLLGFFEILTWLFAIGQTMRNLHNPACFLAFAAGFTLGNFLGILIEKMLAMGMVIVRIITHQDATELVTHLRAANFGVTCVEGLGAKGKVQIIMTVVKRKQLPEVTAYIATHHPQAFYAVEELQAASKGIFPAAKSGPGVLPLPVRGMLNQFRARGRDTFANRHAA
jgi:uncharacterized protein YebE (UPF0316 family)